MYIFEAGIEDVALPDAHMDYFMILLKRHVLCTFLYFFMQIKKLY